MADYSEDFKQLAEDAGLPTTQDQINTRFDQLREDEGLTITNTNAFGAFWRFIKAVATVPVLWLVNFIIKTVLPQSFVLTATGKWLKLHAQAVNVEPKVKGKAEGQIQFTRADTVGELVIPAGVVVQSTTINSAVYSLVTMVETTFPDGVATILIDMQALNEGAAYNLSAGYYTVLVDEIEGVTVTNLDDWLTKPGTDDEEDEELRSRVLNQYNAINQWHTDAVYTSIIASFDGVTTDNIYFEHDAPRGPGTANAFVMLESGNPTAQFIAQIQSEITDKGNHGHGDDLVIFPMPETTHNVTCTVWPLKTLTDAEKAILLDDVENVIKAAFRENTDYEVTKTQPWDTFSFSELAQNLHELLPNLKNVAFNITFIDSEMNIPRLGTLTVTEHA